MLIVWSCLWRWRWWRRWYYWQCDCTGGTASKNMLLHTFLCLGCKASKPSCWLADGSCGDGDYFIGTGNYDGDYGACTISPASTLALVHALCSELYILGYQLCLYCWFRLINRVGEQSGAEFVAVRPCRNSSLRNLLNGKCDVCIFCVFEVNMLSCVSLCLKYEYCTMHFRY